MTDETTPADPAAATTATDAATAEPVKEAEVKEEKSAEEPVASKQEDAAEAKAEGAAGAAEAEAEAPAVKEEKNNANIPVELSEEDTKAKEAIVERLSFFFSDANVRQDTFVRKLLMDKSTGGTVPLDVLMRFNTIKKHSSKMEVLIAAAKDLKDILKVDETNLTLCRVEPFTPQNMKENIPKSLYLTNLPLVPVDSGAVPEEKTEKKEGEETKDGDKAVAGETAGDVAKKYDVTVDEIREAFDQYGKVVIVKLKFGNAPPPPPPSDNSKSQYGHYGHNNRGNHNHRGNSYGPKIPLGEAMVEFETVEGQQKAVEATLTIKNGEKVESKEVIAFGSSDDKQPVQVKLLSEWIEDLRNNRDNDRKNKKKRSRDEEEEEEPLPTYEYDWKPGCVIRLTGLPEDSCDREAILDAVAKGLDIDVDEVKSRKIYADYSRGLTNGAIRFLTPDDGIAALAKKMKDGDIKIGSNGEGHQVSDAVILEGEEEKAYWQNFIDFKTKQVQEKEREKRAKKKRRGGGGGRGGGHGHHRGGHRGGGGRGGGGHGHYGRDRKDRR